MQFWITKYKEGGGAFLRKFFLPGKGKFRAKKMSESNHGMCIICQADIEPLDNKMTTECGHSYHSDCIKKWYAVKPRCPICTKKIDLPEFHEWRDVGCYMSIAAIPMIIIFLLGMAVEIMNENPESSLLCFLDTNGRENVKIGAFRIFLDSFLCVEIITVIPFMLIGSIIKGDSPLRFPFPCSDIIIERQTELVLIKAAFWSQIFYIVCIFACFIIFSNYWTVRTLFAPILNWIKHTLNSIAMWITKVCGFITQSAAKILNPVYANSGAICNFLEVSFLVLSAICTAYTFYSLQMIKIQ